MRSFLFAFAFAASSLLVGCGSPKAGDKCDTTGFLCADSTTALECKSSAWVSLPCRGPNGCARAGQTVTCDMSANQEGDACASTAEAKGLCAPDGLSTLECRGGVLVKASTCRSCSVVNGVVDCQH
jgi:hypothetical protein